MCICPECVRRQDVWDSCLGEQAQRGSGGPEEEAAVVCWEPGAAGQRCWQTEGCYSWDSPAQRAGQALLSSHSSYLLTLISFTFRIYIEVFLVLRCHVMLSILCFNVHRINHENMVPVKFSCSLIKPGSPPLYQVDRWFFAGFFFQRSVQPQMNSMTSFKNIMDLKSNWTPNCSFNPCLSFIQYSCLPWQSYNMRFTHIIAALQSVARFQSLHLSSKRRLIDVTTVLFIVDDCMAICSLVMRTN